MTTHSHACDCDVWTNEAEVIISLWYIVADLSQAETHDTMYHISQYVILIIFTHSASSQDYMGRWLPNEISILTQNLYSCDSKITLPQNISAATCQSKCKQFIFWQSLWIILKHLISEKDLISTDFRLRFH